MSLGRSVGDLEDHLNIANYSPYKLSDSLTCSTTLFFKSSHLFCPSSLDKLKTPVDGFCSVPSHRSR